MIWIIGSGHMAEEYVKVLKQLGCSFKVIGRGEESARKLSNKLGIDVLSGGLENFLLSKPHKCDHAIVTVTVDQLTHVTHQLVKYGIKNILLEKPGFVDLSAGKKLALLAKNQKAKIVIAYNRRHYTSTTEAQKIIAADGGVSSFHFEFTEWPHVITKYEKSKTELSHWMFVNSTHVMDLAFYLGGFPKQMKCFVTGKNKLKWHPKKGSIFTGSGVTKSKALFSYCANWLAPGRWNLEVMTAKHRLIFRPMEELQIQEIGSVKISPVEINRQIDIDFKPGIFLQVQKFLAGETKEFCTLSQQVEHFKIYSGILNGK